MPTLIRPTEKEKQQARLQKEPSGCIPLPEKARQAFEALRVKIADSLLTRLYQEIDGFERLSANWDADGAHEISPQVIRNAKHMLRLIADRARARGVPWNSPSISPTPDGGIDFHWEGNERWATLSVVPEQDSLECVMPGADGNAIFRVVPRVEAIEAALWAMSG